MFVVLTSGAIGMTRWSLALAILVMKKVWGTFFTRAKQLESEEGLGNLDTRAKQLESEEGLGNLFHPSQAIRERGRFPTEAWNSLEVAAIPHHKGSIS